MDDDKNTTSLPPLGEISTYDVVVANAPAATKEKEEERGGHTRRSPPCASDHWSFKYNTALKNLPVTAAVEALLPLFSTQELHELSQDANLHPLVSRGAKAFLDDLGWKPPTFH